MKIRKTFILAVALSAAVVFAILGGIAAHQFQASPVIAIGPISPPDDDTGGGNIIAIGPISPPDDDTGGGNIARA